MHNIYLRPIYRRMMSLGLSAKILRVLVLVAIVAGLWYLVSCLMPKSKEEQSIHDHAAVKVDQTGSDLHKDELVVQVPSLLRLGVFYEALCPDSRHYIVQQLSPAFAVLKDVIELELVPYGKASTHHQPDGSLKFKCQHGPKECLANKVHACVTSIVKDASLALQYIHCMIEINSGPVDPVGAGERCIKSDSWNDIRTCATTEKGDAILHHMGKMTHNLVPRVSFIPTVTVNGSQKQQNMLLKDLKSTLCKMYKGPKPSVCS